MIFQDYVIEDNTYEMEVNDIVLELRTAYDTKTKQILYDLDGELFTLLYDFCTAGLEVYYAVFKSSDRFE